MSIESMAIKVLKEEARAILRLVDYINEDFTNAVNLIASTKGRVITTGMGKSGHIAQKVSATMASTGTPSMFLHPAEGIHGDLGMITMDDIVLAFSNSGETSEVLNLIPSIKRIGAKIISIVGNLNSTLSNFSNISLYAGVEKEADLLNLAPTSSTTATLALGDALAISLSNIHHFTSEQFAVYHPGGTLGKKLLLTVKDIMHKDEDNPLVYIGESVKTALFVMTDKGLGAVSVRDKNNKLKGLITDGDIRRGLGRKEEFLQLKVEDVMNDHPATITENKLAEYALHLMEQHCPKPITVLPVTNQHNQVIGMIHMTDLLKCGII